MAVAPLHDGLSPVDAGDDGKQEQRQGAAEVNQIGDAQNPDRHHDVEG